MTEYCNIVMIRTLIGCREFGPMSHTVRRSAVFELIIIIIIMVIFKCYFSGELIALS